MSDRAVLVVDDDVSLREMVVDFLGTLGIAASGAGSAEEALRIVDRGGVDLVLCDYRLPDRDGIALIEAIAARTIERRVRCVMMSGDPGAQDALQERGGSGVVFLRKPFGLPTLEVLIRRLCLKRSSGLLPRVA